MRGIGSNDLRSGGFGTALALGVALVAVPASAQAPQPASPQPSLPQSEPGVPMTSPLLGGGGAAAKPLVVRKKVSRTMGGRRHVARSHRYDELERPALAGVELVAPLPHPVQPPHLTVPVPAYPLENFVTFYTTPPPPVVCHRTPRDPYAPDPNLIRERTLACEADNP